MKRFQSYRQLLGHFRDTTIMHALPHTSNSISHPFRVFWAFAFVAGFIALSFQLVTLWITYTTYPVQVKIFLQTSRSLRFPAVTFCNLNPVKRSSIRCTDLNDLVSVQSKMDYTASLITTLSNLETTNDTSLPLAYIDPAKAEYSCNGTTVTPSANPMIDDTVQTKPQTRVSVNSYISQSYSPTSNSTTTSNSSSSSTGGPPGFDLLSSINVNSATFYRDLIKSTDVPDLSNLIDLISPTEAQAIAYGYTADELILECSFDGALCKTSDFSEGYNKRHGKCYTFNDKAETAVNTTKWGSTYGLRVTININISEYIGLLAPEAGVSVSLQTPGSLPVPDMVGISALPGYTTVISFSLTHISRQPYPYTSNCISDFPTAYKPFLPANTTYSLQACQIACVSKAMYDACGCVDRIPMGKYPQCSIKNSTERSCWANISDSQFLPIDNSSALICQCYAACEEAQYVTRVTHSKYPSPAYGLVKMTNFLTMDQIGRFWVGKYNLSANPSKYSTPEWVPDNSPEANLLRVHAFFSDLNYQLIQESPEYPIVRCLSDSGGILGLYLGVSVAALFEIVELIAMLIIFASKKNKKLTMDAQTPKNLAIYNEQVNMF